MKKLKFIFCLLCLVLISTSCKWMFPDPDPYYDHRLQLSFQDTLGNDLVRGLIPDSVSYIDFDLYSLNIYINDVLTSGATMYFTSDTSGYYYLELLAGSRKKNKDPNIKVDFRLNCFDIFGDLRDHVINTWWINHTTCTRIEIDGKEIPFKENILPYNDNIYSAIITLNR